MNNTTKPTESESSSQASIRPVSNSANNKRGYCPNILVILILIITVGIGGYYLGTQNNQTTHTSNIITPPTQAPIPTVYCIGGICPSPYISSTQYTSSSSPSLSSYKKRQYDQNADFAYSKPYPPELKKINDNDLIGMKCTQRYADNVYGPANPNFYLNNENTISNDFIDNTTKKDLIKSVDMQNDDHLSGAQFCLTEDNRIIWNYDTDYGSNKSVSYFDLQIPEGENSQVAKIPIPTDGSIYFSCSKPLMLTKDGKLYYECDAENGNIMNTTSSITIYAIDINTRTNKVIYNCTSTPTNERQRNSPVNIYCTSL